MGCNVWCGSWPLLLGTPGYSCCLCSLSLEETLESRQLSSHALLLDCQVRRPVVDWRTYSFHHVQSSVIFGISSAVAGSLTGPSSGCGLVVFVLQVNVRPACK